MKKPIILFIAIIVGIVVLALLSMKKDFTVEEVREIAALRQEISRFCESGSPDFDVIEKAYQKNMRKLVCWIDDKTGIKMDDKIETSIVEGAKGNIPKINGYIINLTITRIFWEYFLIETANLSDPANAQRARIIAERIFSAEDNHDGRIAIEIKNLLDKDLTKDSTERLRALYESGFLFNFVYELDRAEESKNDSTVFYEHMARAVQWFHILYQEMSQRNRADSVFIYGGLRKKAPEVEFKEIREKLKNSFSSLPFVTDSTFDRDHFSSPKVNDSTNSVINIQTPPKEQN
jgi:hypothetical protein